MVDLVGIGILVGLEFWWFGVVWGVWFVSLWLVVWLWFTWLVCCFAVYSGLAVLGGFAGYFSCCVLV